MCVDRKWGCWSQINKSVPCIHWPLSHLPVLLVMFLQIMKFTIALEDTEYLPIHSTKIYRNFDPSHGYKRIRAGPPSVGGEVLPLRPLPPGHPPHIGGTQVRPREHGAGAQGLRLTVRLGPRPLRAPPLLPASHHGP